MSMLSKGLKNIERKISSVIPHQHSAERRENMYAARDQMQFYQQQKENLTKAAETLSQQKATESQKLHQSQIRALRSHYKRRSALMTSPSSSEPSDKLG